jgi:hypothetical protein
MNITWHNAEAWTVKSVPLQKGKSRRTVSNAAFPPEYLSDDTQIVEVVDVQRKPSRRSLENDFLDFSVPLSGASTFITAVRHASDALTFHAGEIESFRRSAVRKQPAGRIRFRISLRVSPEAMQRRGVATKAIKVILLRVTAKIADHALPTLCKQWEEKRWRQMGLEEGLIHIDRETILDKSAPSPLGQLHGTNTSDVSLLLLHGTFSHTQSAFKGLTDGDFFSRAKKIYGDRIYAFNHFTLSKTPEENANELLATLPANSGPFDVITHSRGGLVLRCLVERTAATKRFNLRKAVLVACPNEGTPLANPVRWKETVGWVANLLEVIPENPLSFAGSWVADAIVWIAYRATGAMPGLQAMDPAGKAIAYLQGPPSPPPGAYATIACNFVPSESMWLRLLDIGVDSFFSGANDLVVPTEGGWRLDHDANIIGPNQVYCFGPGGNLSAGSGNVHHTNLLAQPDAARLIFGLLQGELVTPQIDVNAPMPDRRFRKLRSTTAIERLQPPSALAAPGTIPPLKVKSSLSPVYSDTFNIAILDSDPDVEKYDPQILATYGGARVFEAFPIRSGTHAARWEAITKTHHRIRDYVDGATGSHPPIEHELVEYGMMLFETLFPPEVRRLYDIARAKERAGHLNVIFTSMIPDVAEKPWEFAFDPSRRTFLATEELHFIRHAITTIPADRILPNPGPLRILIAVAQPIGTGKLSSDEEEAVVRRGFQALTDSRLIEIEVLRSASPATLHRYISTGQFDVIHFVGHGEFDEVKQRGFLIFEDGRRAIQRIDVRTAREIMCQRGVQLVFLNACDTGRGGTHDFNRGVAPALIAGGVPAVVANQFKVLDQSATEFAQHFYWALAHGQTIGSAAREARIAVNYSLWGENIDWAIPVVYARDPEGRICEPREFRPDLSSSPLINATVRRSIDTHHKRIAVWDINNSVPKLNSILARMNASQRRFGFQTVDVTVPFGTWRRKKGSSFQLDAEATTARLKFKTQELNVDALLCITEQPIVVEKDGKLDSDYDCWWTEPGDGNIALFSTSLPGMPNTLPDLGRVMTQLCVQGLAGLFGDMVCHKRRPKNCPMYANNERSVQIASVPQKFDRKCAAHLQKEIGEDLAALEAILKIFH